MNQHDVGSTRLGTRNVVFGIHLHPPFLKKACEQGHSEHSMADSDTHRKSSAVVKKVQEYGRLGFQAGIDQVNSGGRGQIT